MAPVIPRVRALDCPNCGGGVELRGHAHTLNAVCIHCLSIIDTSSPALQIIQRFQAAQRIMPLIPLGKRGRLWGAEYDAIGFQVRQIEVEGVAYRWSEYLLYNPFKGYLYLTEYQGHWNAIRTLRALPEMTTSGGRTAVRFGGRTYKHFQNAHATTVYVMGEFPWQIRVGETVEVNDFVCPPHVLSAEKTAGEVVWSSGTYVAGREIWQAFQLPGSPPAPQGVYANQPSPHAGKVWSSWKTFAVLFGLWIVALALTLALGNEREVFRQRYAFSTTSRGEQAFVTPVFDFSGRESNAEVKISTDLNNDWAQFQLALINNETGLAYNRSQEISYYSGTDSDGAWTEGGRSESATFPAIPPGSYYLRIEPDMDEDGRPHMVNYEVVVTYGSIGVGWLMIVLLLLPIPAILRTVKAFSFEHTRWSESDYGSPYGTTSSSKDDD